ncbi:hypothetical protein ABTX35_02095 [Streptomyces sp. NPDC096080]|uniref:hypothetical protein n=1 Tax=Streptomyces sp. NPDC096080 TaxID=3156693 RepID=UPI00331B6B3E
MTTAPLPSATALTRAQYDGWACVLCRAPIQTGGVLVGRAVGAIGVHDLSVDVYACGGCARGRRERGDRS